MLVFRPITTAGESEMILPILPPTLAQAVTITDQNEAEIFALHMREIVQASLPTAIDGRVDLYIQGSRRRGTAVEERPDLDLIAEAYVNRCGYEADADLLVTWKNSVEQQLVSRWGGTAIRRLNGALRVQAVIPCDLVLAFHHSEKRKGRIEHGIWFVTESNPVTSFIDWPEQVHANILFKDRMNGGRVLQTIRLLKRLRNQCCECWCNSVDLPSFLLESIAWNIPDKIYQREHPDCLKAATQWLCRLPLISLESLLDASGLDPLFRPDQPWTIAIVRRFIKLVADQIECT